MENIRFLGKQIVPEEMLTNFQWKQILTVPGTVISVTNKIYVKRDKYHECVLCYNGKIVWYIYPHLPFIYLQEKKAVDKIKKVKAQEKNILLQNIQNLEDADSDDELNKLPLSPDGKYLVLTAAEEDDDAVEDFSSKNNLIL